VPNKSTLTVPDASEELNCSPNHIRKFINSGELRSFKLGQLRLINREALDELRFRLEKEHTSEMVG
jgi:excisionase family DNA binding protein